MLHEAGGINGANLQERCRGSKRGQPPGELERASRHGPETAQTLLAQRTSGNDPSFLLWSTTLENLVCFGVTWQLNPLGTRVFSLMISYFFPVVNLTSAPCRPTADRISFVFQ